MLDPVMLLISRICMLFTPPKPWIMFPVALIPAGISSAFWFTVIDGPGPTAAKFVGIYIGALAQVSILWWLKSKQVKRNEAKKQAAYLEARASTQGAPQ